MLRTAIVILNWNGRNYLEKFLPSVVNYSSGENTEVIIADNDSTDGSLLFMEEHYPEIRVIRLDRNYGYSKGYNLALTQVDADIFVLLNSDIEVTPAWIDPIVSLMEKDEKIAACMPKIKSFADRDCFEYAGAAGGFIDRYGYPFCRGRIFNVIEKDIGQYDSSREIFWASGACMFLRASIYHLAGGLDDDFFAHMEEIDLCWRFKNMGYKIMFCPESTVFHVGGGTLPNNSPQKIYLNFRNNIWLLFKNLPPGKLRIILPLRIILDGMAAIKFLTEFRFSFFLSVLKAHYSFYGSFRNISAKRKLMRPGITKYDHPEIYQGSIAIAFFLKGIKFFSQIRL
ncbi:MAG: glycosyltransferase [Bacteroidia bacterium]|nr:glycosyltransferase [Bacteroidia bacterium]